MSTFDSALLTLANKTFFRREGNVYNSVLQTEYDFPKHDFHAVHMSAHLDAYNHFVIHGIRDILSKKIDMPSMLIEFDTDTIQYRHASETLKEEGEDVTHMEALTKGFTYKVIVYADVKITRKGQVSIIKNVAVSHIPIMKGSIFCATSKFTKQAFNVNPIEMKTHYTDPHGYFITGGAEGAGERAVISRERLAQNRHFTVRISSGGKKKLQSEILCVNPVDGRISEVKMFIRDDRNKLSSRRNVSAVLSSFMKMDKDKESCYGNLVFYYRVALMLRNIWDKGITLAPENEQAYVLGDNTYLEEALSLFEADIATICQGNTDLHELISQKFEPTVECAEDLEDEVFFEQVKTIFANKKPAPIFGKKKRKARPQPPNRVPLYKAEELLGMHFFSHVTGDDRWEVMRRKLWHMTNMAIDLIRTYYDYGDVSDKNHYAVKRVETPGTRLHSLYVKFHRNMNQKLVEKLSDLETSKAARQATQGEIKLRIEDLAEKEVGNNIESSIHNGSWGVKNGKSNKVGASQPLGRLSVMDALAYLRRLSPPNSDNAGSKNRQVEPKLVHPSSDGIVCVLDTPEGQNIGVVKHLTVPAYPSFDLHDPELRPRLLRYIADAQKAKKETAGFGPVIYNGEYLGYVPVVEVQKKLIARRRDGVIDHRTTIAIVIKSDDFEGGELIELHVDTSAGRVLRPLAIVNTETGKTLLEEGLASGELPPNFDDILWEDLVKGGYVEWIDKKEEMQYQVAYKPSQVKINVHTHCELDSAWMFSINASLIPHVSMMPSPRGQFFSQMVKQATGTPLVNHKQRFDTTLLVARSSQQALVRTKMYEYIYLNDFPFGRNVRVAIMPLTGDNMEDAILVREGYINHGTPRGTTHVDVPYNKVGALGTKPFVTDVTKTYTKKYKGRLVDEPQEELSSANIGGSLPYEDNYVDGVIKPGTKLQNGDTLIAKTFQETVSGTGECKETIVKERYRDNRTAYAEGSISGGKNRDAKVFGVKISVENNPMMGDKYASRYAQKGVMGRIVPDEEIPYAIEIVDGEEHKVRPDFIINPAMMPSRMTAGQIMEMYVSELIAAYDPRRVAEYFDDFYLPVEYMGGEDFEVFTYTLDGATLTLQKGVEQSQDGEYYIMSDKLPKMWQTYFEGITKIALDKPETRSGDYYNIEGTHLYFIANNNVKLRKGEDVVRFSTLPEDVQQMYRESYDTNIIPLRHLIDDWKVSELNDWLIDVAVDEDDEDVYYLGNTTLSQDEVFKVQSIKYKGSFEHVIQFSHLSEDKQRKYKADHGDKVVPDWRLLNQSTKVFRKSIAFKTALRDATAFKTKITPDFIEKVRKERERHNMTPMSYHRMYMDDDKGRSFVLNSEREGIFMGFAYYAALKHLVSGKIHSRSTGRIQSLNRQATEGKMRDGGHRIGAMEFLALQSHGASYLHHERALSDAFVTFIDDAGAMCYYNNKTEKIIPEYASGGENPKSVVIPYSFLLFAREMAAIGIHMDCDVGRRTRIPWSRRPYKPKQ